MAHAQDSMNPTAAPEEEGSAALWLNYTQLTGGTALATRNQAQVAWSQACAALDMENILVMLDVQADRTRFLALPGSAAANGLIRSPLACAFASHPQHKGLGIYVHHIQGGTAAVLHTTERFEALFNSVASIQSWLAAHEQSGLSVFDVSNLGASQAWEFKPLRLRMTQDARDAMRSVTQMSFWGSVVALVLAGLGGLGVQLYQFTAARDTQTTSLMVTELATKEIGAYSNTLFELTRVSSLVVKTGGWIEKYSFKDGTTRFDARVPEWVTPDVIKGLGPVTTEKDYVRNMVMVRRGEADKP